MKPLYFVFCEGESEEEYINFLKSEYRLPNIKIKSKVAGTAISAGEIRNQLKSENRQSNDPIFLMYDLDRDDITATLKSIKGTTLIGSKPSIELWYLLHCIPIQVLISSSSQAEAMLKKFWKRYKKGFLSQSEKCALRENVVIAINNAEVIRTLPIDTFTDIPIFIQELETLKNQ